MRRDLSGAAISALDAGFSVFPLRDPWLASETGELIKTVSYSWLPLKTERLTPVQARKEFHSAFGLAIVCGAISDGLWVLDFDEAGLVTEYLELALQSVEFVPCPVETPSGGCHLYFRCESGEVRGNEKLAMSEDGQSVRIETRGEGGIVFAPPTPGYTGRLNNVPVVSADDIDILRGVAMGFDQRPPKAAYVPVQRGERAGERPGDRFDAATDWHALLLDLGWKHAQRRGAIDYWTRPGKTAGISASTNAKGTDEIHVFSSSVPQLEPGRNYTRFEVWAFYAHGGDFGKAARAALALYGKPDLPATRQVDIPDWSDVPDFPDLPDAPVVVLSEARTYSQTDVGNADRIYDEYRDRVRWCADEMKWLVWDGRRWVRDAKGQTVAGFHIDIARAMTEDRELSAWGQKCLQRSRITAAVEVLKALPGIAITSEDLDADPYILNVWNGVVDLRTGHLSAHDPQRLLTRITSAAHLPDDNTVPERFAKFLEQITCGDLGMMQALMRFFGYSLTGLTRSEKWLIGIGRGANGKSTLARVLMKLMGSYAAHMPASIVLNSPIDRASQELPALTGVRLAVIEEPNTRTPLDRERVKMLVTGGGIPINPKYEQPRVLHWIGKIFLLANDRPRVDFDYAFARRTMVAPFDMQLTDQDKDLGLEEKILDESDHILTWLVAEAASYFSGGLLSCERMDEEAQVYLEDSSTLDTWIEERVIEEEGCYLRKQDAYGAYSRYAEAINERPISLPTFKQALRFRGWKTDRRGKGGAWCYVNVAIADENGEPAHWAGLE